MNQFLNTMKSNTNYGLTENGAVTHRSTLNPIMDMFALGGAYRSRSDDDCIVLFKRAYDVDPTLAMKCLFYLRDARGGQGERRYFRVVLNWLASYAPAAVARNLEYIPEYGRWDDLYALVGTQLEDQVFALIRKQLTLDVNSKTPSLLAKWLKSENTSSKKSRALGTKTREALRFTSRQYRKTLAILRERIRIVEKLMSQNRWDEIEFDKIPSRAGFIYRNAFARRDMIKERYEKFAKNKETKVNASVLYPHEIAHRAYTETFRQVLDDPNRLMLQKYWDNLPNYYGDRVENGLAIVDTSGSMTMNGGLPLEVAVSMGAYIADKAKGPFKNHFITFSSTPELIEFEGVDIVDKLRRARRASWQGSTNLEAVFDLLLNTAKSSNMAAEDMPKRLYIFSDMEFNCGCLSFGSPVYRNPWSGFSYNYVNTANEVNTLMESIAKKWAHEGYKLPDVIFWNVNARNNNIPAIGPGFSYVSGFSPVMIETILSGKDGLDLVLEKLNSKRYVPIH